LATLASPGVSATARSRPDVTDHDLVQAVRAGDDHAFERLYHRYHRRISAYIFGMVHDHGRAEDLTQEVFVSALRRMRQTDRPIAFKPWIYEIAKNACIDQFRRTSRTEEVSIDAEDGAGLAPADHGKLQARGPSPDDAVESKQQLADLQGAFGGLSDAHHQILVMRELEGLSYREIGERLGMSRPSVESTLFRARRRLTEEYEELRTGERCLRIQEIIGRASEASVARLGLRDQRRVGSHISHCQPCRKHAVMAGLDAAGIARRPVRAKIAAFLPLPAFLKKRWLESIGGGDGGSSSVPVDPVAGHALTQASLAAAQYGDSTMAGWMKATAVAAAVAVAGVGTGAAEHVGGGGAQRHEAPVAHHVVAASTPASGGGAIAAGGARRPASLPATATRAGGGASHSSSAGRAGRAAAGTAGGAGSTSSSGGNHFSGATAPAGGAGGNSSGSSSGSGSSSQSASSAASKDGASHTTTTASDPVKQAASTVTGAAGAATGAATGGGSTSSSTPPPPLVDPNLGALTQPASTPPPTSVGGVVTGATDTVGNTVGGAVGDTVKQTGAAVGDTVDKVTDGLGQAVGGLLGGGKTSGQ
jgi:RNA polymerase sigma factor (sigma-70 family)